MNAIEIAAKEYWLMLENFSGNSISLWLYLMGSETERMILKDLINASYNAGCMNSK